MLRGIPENISPELLKALADMGHGDLIEYASGSQRDHNLLYALPAECRCSFFCSFQAVHLHAGHLLCFHLIGGHHIHFGETRDSFANVALDVMKELGMPKDHIFFNETDATGIALISLGVTIYTLERHSSDTGK